MFSVYELYHRLESGKKSTLPLRRFDFVPHDFATGPASQQTMSVFRIEREACTDPLGFYLACADMIHDHPDYPAREYLYEYPPLFQSLSREEADHWMGYSYLIRRPKPPMFDPALYVQAWYAEINDLDEQVLVEFKDAYVSFFWFLGA